MGSGGKKRSLGNKVGQQRAHQFRFYAWSLRTFKSNLFSGRVSDVDQKNRRLVSIFLRKCTGASHSVIMTIV